MHKLWFFFGLFLVVFFSFSIVFAVSPSDFNLKEGDLISAIFSDDPDVYIINEHGYKRLFLNPEIFKFYTHLGGFTNVKLVTPEVRDAFPTVGLFRNCEKNDPKVYGFQSDDEDSGELRWVNTSGDEAVKDDPDFFKKVFCINDKEFKWYKRGEELKSVKEVPQYHRATSETPAIPAIPATLASTSQPFSPAASQSVPLSPSLTPKPASGSFTLTPIPVIQSATPATPATPAISAQPASSTPAPIPTPTTSPTPSVTASPLATLTPTPTPTPTPTTTSSLCPDLILSLEDAAGNNRTSFVVGESGYVRFSCSSAVSLSFLMFRPNGTTWKLGGSYSTGAINGFGVLMTGNHTVKACYDGYVCNSVGGSISFNASSATPTPTPTPTTSSTSYDFNRDLYFSLRGDDVKRLQTALIILVNYPSNLVTGYFGNITRDAVKRLQEKYGVKPISGYFGEITRQKLQALFLAL